MPHSTHWHILGAGSIGGLFAARMAAAGIPLTLLLRDDAALAAWHAAGGLTLDTEDGTRQRWPLPACTVATAGPVVRHLLVTTKTPDTLPALAPLLHGDGAGQLVLLLQNGMGGADAVRARWPGLRLWSGVTTAGAWCPARFHVQRVATGSTQAGRQDAAGDARLDAALDALFAAGICTRVDDPRPLQWQKLAVNAMINALTALHRCRNGELRDIPAAAARLAPLAAEIEAVAAAEGMHLPAPVLDSALAVMAQTAGNWSSMNRDVTAGRTTEIDAINGYVCARAAVHGIPVPENRALLAAVRALHPGGDRHATAGDASTPA